MKMPLISVIVPVYNVEKYLDRCIRSILNQSYSNLEIILVDDGSPDNSSQICDEYSCRDCRIRVIHKENGGLSSARNAGIAVAKGDYIAFVDSDDWIDSQMYLKLMNAIQAQNSDIACCSFSYVYDCDGSHEYKYQPYQLPVQEKKIQTVEYETYMHDFSKYTLMFLIITVNKLYRRSIFDTIRFAEGKRCEDEIIFHEVLANSRRISVIGDPLYFYYQSKQSITRGEDNWINCCFLVEALRGRSLFFSNTPYKQSFEQCLGEYLLSVIREWDKLRRFEAARAADELHFFRHLSKQVEICGRLSKKTRLLIRLFSYAPDILFRIYKTLT